MWLDSGSLLLHPAPEEGAVPTQRAGMRVGWCVTVCVVGVRWGGGCRVELRDQVEPSYRNLEEPDFVYRVTL